MGRQQQLLQDGQELGVCTKTETTDGYKNWWQTLQQYLRSNSRSIGKIILTMAAMLVGARFMLNAWDGMQHRKVCMAGAITSSTINHPSAQPIQCIRYMSLFYIHLSYYSPLSRCLYVYRFPSHNFMF